jgi:tight adherence protein B
MDYAQLILISVFGALTIYFVVRMVIPQSEKEIVEQRVSKYFKGKSIEDVADQVIKERQKKKDTGKTGRLLVSKDFSEYILSSGIKFTPSEFVYAWLGLTFVPLAVLSLIGANPITVAAVTLVGFAIPPFFLQRSRKKMQELFTKQLGEALVIMGNAVRGGFSFRQAMDGIARDMQPPIASEFAMTIREINYGVSQLDALQHMTQRVKNPDLDLLVCAVSITAQVGGNLSDILDIIATTIKDRIRIKQEVKVLTASGRMSALIIGLLPVFLVVALMILNPRYFAGFFQSTLGIVLLVVSVVMEMIGFFIIRKISDVKY